VKDLRPQEIASFNRELMNFDVGDLSVEELDRRLELAVANTLIGLFGCSSDCSSNCTGFSCTTNCGNNMPKKLQD
jgi:hypothetical protein